MDIESIRHYCLSKLAATEDTPFGDEVLAFRVMGKIFGLVSLDPRDLEKGVSINLKCDPDYAVELREKYTDIQPGYHMNKKHWNTVQCENGLDVQLIKSLIDHSYELIVKSLTKAQRELLL